MRKHWFQSLTSTQPESAWEEPAAPNARKASVSEIESSFFIKGRCWEEEGNPFKGKPGQSQRKKFNWHPAKFQC